MASKCIEKDSTSACYTCFDSQTSVRNVCMKKRENKGQNFEAFDTLLFPEIAKHVPIKLCARDKIVKMRQMELACAAGVVGGRKTGVNAREK